MILYYRDPEPQPADPEKEQENLELTEEQMEEAAGGRGGHHKPPSPKSNEI